MKRWIIGILFGWSPAERVRPGHLCEHPHADHRFDIDPGVYRLRPHYQAHGDRGSHIADGDFQAHHGSQ